jgi:predicted Zn finger-like uncharacterized protein
MILTCPTCSAQFVVDPVQLGSKGRKVRCGKCGNQWQATAPVVTLPGDAGVVRGTQELKPVPAGSQLPVVPPVPFVAKRNAVAIALPLAILAALPFFFFIGKPHLPKDKAAIQAEAGASSIMLEGVPRTYLRTDHGRTILNIEGVLVNRASDSVALMPQLKAQALNAKRRVVKEWAIPLSVKQLEPGQRLPFSFATPFAEQGVVDIAFHFN